MKQDCCMRSWLCYCALKRVGFVLEVACRCVSRLTLLRVFEIVDMRDAFNVLGISRPCMGVCASAGSVGFWPIIPAALRSLLRSHTNI